MVRGGERRKRRAIIPRGFGELCIIERRRWIDFIIIIITIMGSLRLTEVDKAGGGDYSDERHFSDIDTCILI